EAHTYRDVTMPLEAFWEAPTSRYPASYLSVRWVAAWLGLSTAELGEGLLRLPFAFFGIASIPAMAVVARGMVGRRAALLAALLLACSPWHLYWSQNARCYSMVLFFALLAMGSTFLGAQRRSWWLLGS